MYKDKIKFKMNTNKILISHFKSNNKMITAQNTIFKQFLRIIKFRPWTRTINLFKQAIINNKIKIIKKKRINSNLSYKNFQSQQT